jgi:hypothetical protein
MATNACVSDLFSVNICDMCNVGFSHYRCSFLIITYIILGLFLLCDLARNAHFYILSFSFLTIRHQIFMWLRCAVLSPGWIFFVKCHLSYCWSKSTLFVFCRVLSASPDLNLRIGWCRWHSHGHLLVHQRHPRLQHSSSCRTIVTSPPRHFTQQYTAAQTKHANQVIR